MNPSNKRIFIRNLPPKVTDDDLSKLFSKCGKIEEIIIKNNFAFIEYSTVQSSLNAIKNFNDYNFHGTKIVVEQAKTRNEKIAEKMREKCFKCGDYGHFAKDCRIGIQHNSNNNGNNINMNGGKNIDNIIDKDNKLGFNERKKRFRHCRKSPKRSFNESLSDLEE